MSAERDFVSESAEPQIYATAGEELPDRRIIAEPVIHEEPPYVRDLTTADIKGSPEGAAERRAETGAERHDVVLTSSQTNPRRSKFDPDFRPNIFHFEDNLWNAIWTVAEILSLPIDIGVVGYFGYTGGLLGSVGGPIGALIGAGLGLGAGLIAIAFWRTVRKGTASVVNRVMDRFTT